MSSGFQVLLQAGSAHVLDDPIRCFDAGEKCTKCNVPPGVRGKLHMLLRERLQALLGPGAKIITDSQVEVSKCHSMAVKSALEPQLFYSMKGSTVFGPESPFLLPALRMNTKNSCRKVDAMVMAGHNCAAPPLSE